MIKYLLGGKFNWIDIILEIICIVGIGLIIYLIIITFPELPERIPKHWDYKGKPDQWGGKSNFLTIPVITIMIYIMLTIIPRLSMYLFKVKYPYTYEKTNSTQLLRILRLFKTVMVCMNFLDIYGRSMNFLGKEPVIGMLNVWIQIIIIFSFCGILMYKSPNPYN